MKSWRTVLTIVDTCYHGFQLRWAKTKVDPCGSKIDEVGLEGKVNIKTYQTWNVIIYTTVVTSNG
jgi:hypothetical protein